MAGILNFFNKTKHIIVCVFLIIVYLLGFQKGKDKVRTQQMKGELNAVKMAKKARAGLSDSHRIKRLHDKYKR